MSLTGPVTARPRPPASRPRRRRGRAPRRHGGGGHGSTGCWRSSVAGCPARPVLLFLQEPALANSMHPTFPLRPDQIERPADRRGRRARHRGVSSGCRSTAGPTGRCCCAPASAPRRPGRRTARDGGDRDRPVPRERRDHRLGCGARRRAARASSPNGCGSGSSDLWCELTRLGIDPLLLRERSIITPAAGLGNFGISQAERMRRADPGARPPGSAPDPRRPSLHRRVARGIGRPTPSRASASCSDDLPDDPVPRVAALARARRALQRRVLRAGRAERPRRRLRRRRARAAAARGRASRPGHARQPHPAGGLRAVVAVRAGRPPRADDVARQRHGRGRAHGVGRAHRPAARRPRPRRRRGPLRLRAEDRRPGHVASATRAAASSRPPPGATVGSARTSPPTSRRSTAVPDQLARATRPRWSRSAARSTCRSPRSRRSTSRQERGRQAALRQPPQHRGRLAAPEGPAITGVARPVVLVLPAGRGRGRPDARAAHAATLDWSGGSASRSTPRPRSSTTSTRSTRSAAHWLEHRHDLALRDRRRRGEGRRRCRCSATSGSRRRRPLGHRLQVPARGAHHRPARHPGVDRPHRQGHALRRCSSRCSCGGSTVGLATLHNEDQVAAQGRATRRHRDRAQGRRRHPRGGRPGAGRAARRARSRGRSPRPARATSHSELVRLEGEAQHRCVNPECPNQRLAAARPLRQPGRHGHRRLRREAGRAGSSSSGCSHDVADIYSLDFDAVADARRATSSARSTTCATPSRRRRRDRSPTCCSGSTSSTSGASVAEVLAAAFGHLDRLMAATTDELAATEGVGPVIAASVHAFFATESNRALVERLRAAGLNFDGPDRVRRAADPGRHVGRGHRHARGLHPRRGRGGHQGPRRQEPRQRVEEDDRRGRGRRARRVEADQGQRAGRPAARRSAVRPPARDGSASVTDADHGRDGERRFDAVLFDFGGVFIDSPFEATERAAATLGISPDAAHRGRVRQLRPRRRPSVAPTRARRGPLRGGPHRDRRARRARPGCGERRSARRCWPSWAPRRASPRDFMIDLVRDIRAPGLRTGWSPTTSPSSRSFWRNAAAARRAVRRRRSTRARWDPQTEPGDLRPGLRAARRRARPHAVRRRLRRATSPAPSGPGWSAVCCGYTARRRAAVAEIADRCCGA